MPDNIFNCSDDASWDRFVINLNGEKSTIFMTAGAHTDENYTLLKPLNFQRTSEKFHIYSTEGDITEVVLIPKNVIGKFSRSFEVQINFKQLSSGRVNSALLKCYSAIL